MARHRFVVDGVEHVVTVEALDGGYGVIIDDADPIDVQALVSGGLITTFQGGRPSRAFVARHHRGQEQGYNVTVDGRRFEVRAASASRRGRSVVGGAEDPPGKVTAPLAGVVVAVNVAVGDHVEAGAVLAVVEAMKMQNEVHAPVPGTVTAVRVEAGARCERGDLLVEYTPDA
jgi:propionyl-CoA carboxylase alpha chain